MAPIQDCPPPPRKHFRENSLKAEVFSQTKYSFEKRSGIVRKDWLRYWLNDNKAILYFENNISPIINLIYLEVGRETGYDLVNQCLEKAIQNDADVDLFFMFLPKYIVENDEAISLDGLNTKINERIPYIIESKMNIPVLDFLGMYMYGGNMAIECSGYFEQDYNDEYDALIKVAIFEDLGLKFNLLSDFTDCMDVLSFGHDLSKLGNRVSNKYLIDNLVEEYVKKLLVFEKSLNTSTNPNSDGLKKLFSTINVSTLNGNNYHTFLKDLKTAYPNWWSPSGNEFGIRFEDFGFIKSNMTPTSNGNVKSMFNNGDLIVTRKDGSNSTSDLKYGMLIQNDGWKILIANDSGYYHLIYLTQFFNNEYPIFWTMKKKLNK